MQVQKCEYKPTIDPASSGKWERVFLQKELDELERIEATLLGLQDAMRPLIMKWDDLRQK